MPRFVGTHNPDLIYGEDSANGLGADDAILGTTGDDKFNGNPGDDWIFGNAGDDKINGNNGDDRLFGGDGDDRLHGNGGDDTAYGGAGDDDVKGGGGEDTLDGDAGDDSVQGGGGDDDLIYECADNPDETDVDWYDGGEGLDTLILVADHPDCFTCEDIEDFLAHVAIDPSIPFTFDFGLTVVNVEDVVVNTSDDFESGLDGWDTMGLVGTVAAVPEIVGPFDGFPGLPIAAPGGASMVQLASDNAEPIGAPLPGDEVTDAALEGFLGLGAGTLDAALGISATVGSAMQTEVWATAGQTLSFDWLFDAGDYVTAAGGPIPPFNDTAFVVINGTVIELSDVDATGDYGIDGFNTFEWVVAETGCLEVAFGIVDARDGILRSHLLIDDFSVA